VGGIRDDLTDKKVKKIREEDTYETCDGVTLPKTNLGRHAMMQKLMDSRM
jgi:hypothetical protein